jgi:hypothetical protein
VHGASGLLHFLDTIRKRVKMFPLLLAVGAVVGLVGYAIRKSTGPSTKPGDERVRLERLKLRKILTLDEAEDGLVLARRFGDAGSEAKFRIEISRLKKKRIPI